MNDLESKLILSGDASGALKGLDQANKAAQKLAASVSDVGKESQDASSKLAQAFEQAQKNNGGGTGKTLDAGKIKDTAAAFGDLDSAINASQGGIFSAVSAIEQLTNAALSLGPLGLAAAAAIAAVTAGIQILDRENQKYIAILQQSAEANRAVTKAIAEGLTSEDAQARIDELKRATEAEKKLRDENQAILDDASEKIRSQLGLLGEAANRFNGFDDVFVAQVEESTKAISANEAEIRRLEKALRDNETAANDAVIRLEEIRTEEENLNKERQSHATTLQSLRQQEQELIAAFEERKRVQADDLALRKQRQQEDDALKSEFDARKAELDALFASEDSAEAALQRQTAFQNRLVAIEQQGNQAIANLRQQLTERIKDTNSQINDLTKSYNDQRRKAEDEYQRESVNRQREYEQRRLDIEKSFNLTRLQAFARQDALSLFFAQLAKDDELSTLDRDKEQEDTTAREDFQREQEEEKAAFEQRIVEIQTELEEFQRAQQAKIETEQQAIQQRLEAEKASYAEQEKLLADADAKRRAREQAYSDLEEELGKRRSELTQQREADDLRIKEQREQQAQDNALAKIDEKEAAELDALNTLIYKAIELKQEAQNIQIGQQQQDPTLSFNDPRATAKRFQELGGTSKPLPPPSQFFAPGAMFTEPTTLQNARIAEAEPEVIAPLSRLGELGGQQLTFNMPVTVNGGAPEDEDRLARAIARIVKPELEMLVETHAQVLRQQNRPK